MTNPFEAPNRGAGGPGATGSLDIMAALNQGWEATQRNFLTWAGAGVVAGLAVTVSMLLCFLPYLVVGPAIMYGMIRFTLQAIDGEAPFDTVFSGFEKLGEVVPPILIGGLVMFGGLVAIQLPLAVIQFVIGLLDSEIISLVVGLPLSLVFSVAMMVISVRLMFWMYLIADRGTGAIDSLTESWRITEGHTLPLIGLAFISGFLVVVATILCVLPAIPAAMVVYGAQASAYRQLTGNLRG